MTEQTTPQPTISAPALSQIKPLFEVDPTTNAASLNLHPGQREAWDSTARFVVVLAGHQSGKTEFGPHWLAREIHRCGPGDYYAVTATYDLFKLKMLPALQRLFSPRLGWKYYAGDQILLHQASNTRILLRSASSPGGLEAGTARAAWLDECGQDSFTKDAWEAIQRRLAIHQGRVLFTTTIYNFDWLKTDVFDKAKAGDPDYHVIQFASIMNPTYSLQEFERQRRDLPYWKFAMTCLGEYERPAGLIYSDYVDSYCPQTPDGPVDFAQYDPTLHGHLVRPFTPTHEWQRLVGVDFGGTEHTALIWIAEDSSRGVAYAYREVLGGGKSGREHAADALEYCKVDPELKAPRERVRVWAGGSPSEDDDRLTWNLAGVPIVKPFITGLEAGIDYVVMLFRQRRLFVMDSLSGLRTELKNYSRELDSAGQPTLKIEDKDKYHRLDCLRAVGPFLPVEAPELAPEEVEKTIMQQRAEMADMMSKAMEAARMGKRPADKESRGRGWTFISH